MSNMDFNLCVIGQGFVGLPLALTFALKGTTVIGVDIDSKLVNEVNEGITNHVEKYNNKPIKEILKSQLDCENYHCTSDFEFAIKNSKIIIITVGIPIINGKPEMRFLKNCCEKTGENLKQGDLIIIRSTLIPGTTEEVILPIFEKKSKLKAGEDFFVAYSSERISEGNAFEEFINMATLVAGINKISTEKAKLVLAKICDNDVIEASNIKTVEATKIIENVQRDVNIAMSQEFARYCEGIGIDVFEVIELANTHKRVNLLIPGPGVGGYCIPNAYYYMLPKAEENNIDLKICRVARETNDNMSYFIINVLENLLLKTEKKLTECTICILGLSMKDYSNDERLSPPIDIINKLMAKGAKIKAYDPLVSKNYDYKVNSQEDAIKEADAILILAKQHKIIYDELDKIKMLMRSNPIIIDTKNVIDSHKAETEGFLYWKI